MQFGCRLARQWRGVEWVVVGSSVAAAEQCVPDRSFLRESVESILGCKSTRQEQEEYGGNVATVSQVIDIAIVSRC
jgi:hypothetical protein